MAAPPTAASANKGGAAWWDDLRDIAGAARLRSADASDRVAGVQPDTIFEPDNEKELASALRCADAAGLSVVPRGGGTKTGWGNPPTRADVVLSTARLNHIIEHAWADLTVSVEAGCTFQQLQEMLSQHGQRIAVDPLWPERATIGGILSTNDSGTLRIRYGGLRDLIIGMTIALPDGTLASSGGKVVKNVAGYDLPKLATGAMGTLGVITRAVFRLHPLPHNLRSFTFETRDLTDANRVILAVQDSKLAYTGLQARFSEGTAPAVDVRLEGTEAGIAAQTELLRKLAAPATEIATSDAVWQARQELWSSPEAAIAKFSVLSASIAETCGLVRHLSDSFGVRWSAVVQGTGLGLLRLEASSASAIHQVLQALRPELEQMGGSLVVLHRPAALPAIEAWGGVGSAFPLMRNVKQQFDPRGTLNPGRFIGGI
ncbi:MAG TPA: FAD-binding oxidoreductase [Chthoniobacterales bacterium]|nr:FAD-binding oxidoreductase [Chthoniobacterales bacterium]